MLLAGVGHVALATADLERLAAFHADVFGARVSSRGPGHAFIDVGGGVGLHAFERPELAAGAPGVDAAAWRHGPIDHFTLEAASVEAFAEARERLLARGCTTGEVVDFGALVSLFLTDPDGLLVELSLTKPATGFAPPFPVTPFRARAGTGGD